MNKKFIISLSLIIIIMISITLYNIHLYNETIKIQKKLNEIINTEQKKLNNSVKLKIQKENLIRISLSIERLYYYQDKLNSELNQKSDYTYLIEKELDFLSNKLNLILSDNNIKNY